MHAGDQPARFDGNTGQHHHVRCLSCGRVNDLPLSVDVRREQAAARALNYRVLGHHVEVHGLCPSCRDHSPDSSDSRYRANDQGDRRRP